MNSVTILWVDGYREKGPPLSQWLKTGPWQKNTHPRYNTRSLLSINNIEKMLFIDNNKNMFWGKMKHFRRFRVKELSSLCPFVAFDGTIEKTQTYRRTLHIQV